MAENSNAPLNDPWYPTPRTDAAWNASFELRAWGAGGTARAMRDECAKMEREIIALRTELENIANAKLTDAGTKTP